MSLISELFTFLCRGDGLFSHLFPRLPEPPTCSLPTIPLTPPNASFREGHPLWSRRPRPSTRKKLPWYKELTGYQWFVFIVCCLAWDMDCMDQQLFNLARQPAMKELVAKVQKDDLGRLPVLKKQMEEKAKGAKTDAEVMSAQQAADIGESSGKLGDIDLPHRLGDRRHWLWRHGRPVRPGQDPDDHHPALRDLHRP